MKASRAAVTAAARSMSEAEPQLERELRSGYRVVVAADCFPTGMLGYWVRLLADGGLCAWLTATSPARLAPPEGGPPLAGTNPLADPNVVTGSTRSAGKGAAGRVLVGAGQINDVDLAAGEVVVELRRGAGLPQAEVELAIDAAHAPLEQGTRAVIRQTSLSGIANRYVDLQVPEGAGSGTIDDGTTVDQANAAAVA